MGRWLIGFWIALLACGGEALSPEARIHELVAEAKRAIEAGELGDVKPLVSEGYRDSQGNDRRALMAFLLVQLQHHRERHLLTRVRDLELRGEGSARVVVIAGMAGLPISEPEELHRMRADVYRIEVELEDEEGTWRVVSAHWRRTSPRDLL